MGYCDDIGLLTELETDAQGMLDMCYQFSLEHSLPFNPIKSACMAFRGRRARIRPQPKLFLGGVRIACVERTRHLGYHYHWKLGADSHIHDSCSKFSGVSRAIASLPGFHAASLRVAKVLFEACARPILLFGLESVDSDGASHAASTALHRAWMREVRGLVGIRGPSRIIETHGLAGTLPLELLRYQATTTFLRRLSLSPGPAGRLFRAGRSIEGTLAQSLLTTTTASIGAPDNDSCFSWLQTLSAHLLRTRSYNHFFSHSGRAPAWQEGVRARSLWFSSDNDSRSQAENILYNEHFLLAVTSSNMSS